jgi:hypothetical protein
MLSELGKMYFTLRLWNPGQDILINSTDLWRAVSLT